MKSINKRLLSILMVVYFNICAMQPEEGTLEAYYQQQIAEISDDLSQAEAVLEQYPEDSPEYRALTNSFTQLAVERQEYEILLNIRELENSINNLENKIVKNGKIKSAHKNNDKLSKIFALVIDDLKEDVAEKKGELDTLKKILSNLRRRHLDLNADILSVLDSYEKESR